MYIFLIGLSLKLLFWDSRFKVLRSSFIPSAYAWILQSSKDPNMSDLYIRDNKGPEIYPWETPENISALCEKLLLENIDWTLKDKYELISEAELLLKL